MFTNKTLQEISGQKAGSNLKQTMLLTLIDGFLNGDLTEQEFLNDLKAYLG